jgi:hypothetical protein
MSVADIAVGAFRSGHAVVLKARPVITYQASIAPGVSSVDFNATSFVIKACITYKGKNVPSTVRKFIVEFPYIYFLPVFHTHKYIFLRDLHTDLLLFTCSGSMHVDIQKQAMQITSTARKFSDPSGIIFKEIYIELSSLNRILT